MISIRANEYTKFFWTEYQINPHSFDHNFFFHFTISGSLDKDQLTKSVQELVEKQSFLNYHLTFSKGELFWYQTEAISPEAISPLEIFDTDGPERQFIYAPFNLKKGPLYRFGLFKIADSKYNLILVFHRAIFVLQSYEYLFSCLSILYENKKALYFNKQEQIEITYNYYQELEKRLEEVDKEAAHRFWQNALKGSVQQKKVVANNNIDTNYSDFETYTFSLCTDKLELHNLKLTQTSLNSLLLSVYGVLIHNYIASEKVIVGYYLELNQSTKLQVRTQKNLIPIPIDINHKDTFEQLLYSIKLHLKQCFSQQTLYGYLPTTSILSEANITTPNIFFIETPLIEDLLKFGGCQVRLNNQLNLDTLNADLILNFNKTERSLNFSFKYKKSQISIELIHQLSKTFCYLLESCTKKSLIKEKISDIPFLDKDQYKQIVEEWNKTFTEHSGNSNIHKLIEDQAKLTPNNTAVIFQDRKLTYHQLNSQSNTLASYIISTKNSDKEEFILLFLNRSELVLSAMLGVLKSGKAYVPIDTKHPDERILFILNDTKSKCIITDKVSKQKLINILDSNPQIVNAATIVIEEVLDKVSIIEPKNLELNIQGSDLAYVLYTSGTTGTPKGVMIEHAGIVNLALTHADKFGLKNTESKKCLWFSNYVFDAHVSEVYSTLIYGHILHIISDDVRHDIQKLHNYITEHQIYLATIPPALLSNHDVFNLNVLVIAGDSAPKEVFDKYYSRNIIVFNAYGPTEATVCLSMNHYQNNGATNIGEPISNMSAYVLSPKITPLPPGVIGELYIGGVGLARGYLNNEALTKEKFIPNPFFLAQEKQIFPSARLYKTGDLVKWRADGSLEYIGRNDFQIKIRGYRVELQEIERVATTFVGVKQCVVLTKESTNSTNHKYLIGYYTSDRDIHIQELLNYLSSKLPEYMVPASLVKIDKIPITTTGKVDRKALENVTITNNHKYVPPRNEIERVLCSIFSETLETPLDFVGITNDFVQLGGDSISSLQIISKIREKIGILINFETIYKNKTIKSLYDNVFRHKLGNQTKQPKIEAKKQLLITQPNLVNQFISLEYFNKLSNDNEIEDIFLANSLQQGFIYHFLQQEKVDNAYILQLCWKYSININSDVLKKAWLCAQEKYSGLRLRFEWEEAFIQVIEKRQKFNWKFIDISNQTAQEQTKRINALKKKDCQKAYDLRNGSLFRVYLVKQSDTCFTCVFSAHHAILDGWSIPVLLNYVHNSYIQLSNNQMPDTSIDLCYANTQNFIQTNHKHMLKNLDKQLLRAEDDALGLLVNKNVTTNIQDYRQIVSHKTQTLFIKDTLYRTLKLLANNKGITLNAIVQFAWHKVLSVFCNTSETIVGTIVAGRSFPINDIESSVGLYINTLPMIVDHTKTQSILTAIKSIQENILDVNINSAVHLSDFQAKKNKLFNSLFVFENYPARERLFSNTTSYKNTYNWQTQLKITFQDYKGNVNYPLSLMASDLNGLLELKISYEGELFTEELIESILETLRVILKQLDTTNLNKSTTSLKYISSTQESKILQKLFVEMKKQNNTIVSVFESYATCTPDTIALITVDQKITYQQLNMQANALAHYLKTLKLEQSKSLIAIYIENKESIITSMLGILKSGAAYVPIDTGSPEERLRYILENTNVDIILTCTKHEKTLRKIIQTSASLKIINLDRIRTLLSSLPKKNLNVKLSANDLAYVIYTSGSTGRPKGVMIEHTGVVSLVKDINYIVIDSNDIFIQLADIAFDAATFEIWAPLLNGAQLFVPQDSIKLLSDYKDFKKTLEKQNVSIMWLTKTVFDQLILSNISIFQNLKYLLVGGEALNKQLITKLLCSKYAPKNIINGYGPTENTTFSCTYNLKDLQNSFYPSIPIGKPLTNRTALVLNDHHALLPVGAIGELYLGGYGLARGYLNDSELTKEKFVFTQYQEQDISFKLSSHRLYKSGDLCRRLPDGNLEFLGRQDHQIKIRGFRIELAEIENAILSYPKISQVAVLVKDLPTKDCISNKVLTAFYCSSESIDSSLLRSFLIPRLPDYMIPHTFIYLAKLPNTENGKLNYKELLISSDLLAPHNNYAPPKTRLEKKICNIWSEILGVKTENIGTESGFFELGGNSLLSIKLLNKLNKELKTDITLANFLRARTIKNLIKKYFFQKDTAVNKLIFKQDTNLDSGIQPISTGQISSTSPTVFLTGATGLLGAYLLHKLLNSNTQHIYCLIRESTIEGAYDKLKRTFIKYGFNDTLITHSKIKLVLGDFSKPNFLLDTDEFIELAKKVDIIIHNGAEVNHVYPYEHLRNANVKSIEYLLIFAATEKVKTIHYISTLSVLDNNFNQHSASDLNYINLDHGYIATKLAAETLLNKAKSRGFQVNIFRPPLFFHEKNGLLTFNEKNHFYSFLSSLLQLKKYPKLNLVFDILSVDFISECITKISLCHQRTENVFNLTNPNKVSLKTLIENLKIKGFFLEEVPIHDWIQAIHNTPNNLSKFASLYSNDTILSKQFQQTSKIQGMDHDILNELDLKITAISPHNIIRSVLNKMRTDLEISTS